MTGKLPSHILALQAFSYLADDEKKLLEFLVESGLTPQNLHDSIKTEETMAAVMDYFLSHEEVLVPFCEKYDITTDVVWKLRSDLPGAPHNTLS